MFEMARASFSTYVSSCGIGLSDAFVISVRIQDRNSLNKVSPRSRSF